MKLSNQDLVPDRARKTSYFGYWITTTKNTQFIIGQQTFTTQTYPAIQPYIEAIKLALRINN